MILSNVTSYLIFRKGALFAEKRFGLLGETSSSGRLHYPVVMDKK